MCMSESFKIQALIPLFPSEYLFVPTINIYLTENGSSPLGRGRKYSQPWDPLLTPSGGT